ncbi:arylalkylamine N-acetyltransferase 1-like [Toxorhynchites rutilus septentrionalis]|uniref:arylalkylamine N-acetyltransferase 1-like n=1 Tax=Toxorhynchites rutilus septentrionalis TaxID=329112 RepID=UPI00247959B0|nr:arylalkylamine N-acetyltransferase 1-like [Toxorhynchites rutilus septentrionalis]XP_055624794.1 arylalkylamine N-acetyltransferase 1-like [Toxorhynchites rutilus septentrionalis]
MLDNKMNDIHLETISISYFDKVIDHLRQTFFADEPLNKAVELTRPGQGHKLLELHCLSTLKDNVSVMAITNDGQIAGVALNGILRGNDDILQAMEKLNYVYDESFKKIFKLLYEQNLKIDLFNHFNVDKMFEIRILSVDTKFRGQGLAKKLIAKSEEVALEHNIKVIKTDATGAFSQRVVGSLGFVTKGEIKYKDYLDEQGDTIFVVDPPHEKLKIMCKIIN